MKRKIAAILAADIAGYSRLVADDEEDTLRRLAAYREVFFDFVVKAGGRVFNTAGDSVLAEFGSAVEATRCAIDIQESLRTRNLGYQTTRQMLFRIGITIGDVVEREGDLLGDGVNIAARLEGLAAAGGICVSRSVYEQVANKLSVPFRDIGEQEVKNIPQRVHAFMVEMRGEDGTPSLASARNALAVTARAPAQGTPRWMGVLAGAGVGLGAAALAVVLLRPSEPSRRPRHPVITSNISPGTPPSAAFALLARNGGIIRDAKTAPELYHNARSFEARGEPAAARRAYLELAALGGDAIDPHLRFAALLRAQDGRAGAREVYAHLRDTTTGRAVKLVYAMQFDADERHKRLDEFINANRDYAPAYFILAQEFSEEWLGNQTLYDKRRQFDALGLFLKADAEGKLVPFFLDQSVLAEWLDRARKEHAALEAFLKTAHLAPSASFMRSNSGWTVSVSLPEAATKVLYRIGETGEYVSTGTLPVLDQRTGKPIPNTSFEMPPDAAATTIQVRYEDAAGRSVGPFPIAFDPRSALISDERDILERFSNSWIAVNADAGAGPLVYFTQLVSYRCAIAKAEMGFDDAPPSLVLPIPGCDEHDPQAIPAATKPYLAAPRGTKTVSVRLTYVDGTLSTKAFKVQ
jgi:class 3 adenylate cyclase